MKNDPENLAPVRSRARFGVMRRVGTVYQPDRVGAQLEPEPRVDIRAEIACGLAHCFHSNLRRPLPRCRVRRARRPP